MFEKKKLAEIDFFSSEKKVKINVWSEIKKIVYVTNIREVISMLSSGAMLSLILSVSDALSLGKQIEILQNVKLNSLCFMIYAILIVTNSIKDLFNNEYNPKIKPIFNFLKMVCMISILIPSHNQPSVLIDLLIKTIQYANKYVGLS